MKKMINEKMLNVNLGEGSLKDLKEAAGLAAFAYFENFNQDDINQIGSKILLNHRDTASKKYICLDFSQKTKPSYSNRFRGTEVIKRSLFTLNDDLSLNKVSEEEEEQVRRENRLLSYNNIFSIEVLMDKELDEYIDESDVKNYEFVFKQGRHFDIDNITHYIDSYSKSYDKLYTFIAPVGVSEEKKEIFLQQFNIRGYLNIPSTPMSADEIIEYLSNNKCIKFAKVLEVTSNQEDRMNFEYPFIGYIYTDKHKGRFISPDNRIHQAHKAPIKILDNFSTVLPELIFDEKIINLLNTIDNVEVDDLENGYDILDKLISYKPDEKKLIKRSGAHRFSPLGISDKSLVEKSIENYMSELSIMPFNRIYSTSNFISSKNVSHGVELEIDGVSIKVDLSKEKITCPKCKDVVDYTLFGEARGEKKNFGDIYCSCGHLNIPSETIISNPDSKRYILIDKDNKGKIILRSVSISLNRLYWEEGLFDLSMQMQRIIIYTKDSSLKPTFYDYSLRTNLTFDDLNDTSKIINKLEKELEANDSSFEFLEYETASNDIYFHDTKDSIRMLQNKIDILKVIDETDYKYSGLEDFICSNTIKKETISLPNISQYLSIYKWFDGIEKIARIEQIHPLLEEILSITAYDMNSEFAMINKLNQTIDTVNTKSIKDILKLTSEQYSVFLGTERTREQLLVCQRVENQEEYNFLRDNNLSTYTLSQIKDISELTGKKTSMICDYLLRVDVYQAIDPDYATTLLLDYIRMAESLRYDFSSNDILFPNSLKREHDVASREFENLKYKKYTEEEEKEVIDSLKEYEFEAGDFKVIAPKELEDIRDEGNKQKHCVSSYIDSVYQRKTNILFMRSKTNLSKPLYTIEVINHKIVQIRGFANKEVDTINEKIFVEKYKGFLKELREEQLYKRS